MDRPPTSASLLSYLGRHAGAPRALLCPRGWPDPDNAADTVVLGEVGLTASALAEALPEGEPPSAWRARWAEAGRAARAAADELLDGPFSEGAAARAAVRGTPQGGLLVLGNSYPIRHVETYVPGSARDLGVLAQRGVNGIDGLVAGAAGAAGASARPTTLLLGDVSLLHDLSGLALAARAPTSLAVVVLNNGGGRIFEMLPIAGIPGAPMAHFTTPHAHDLGAAARAFAVPHAAVEDEGGLAEALAEAHARPGARLIEARVPASGAAAMLDRLREAMARWPGEGAP